MNAPVEPGEKESSVLIGTWALVIDCLAVGGAYCTAMAWSLGA